MRKLLLILCFLFSGCVSNSNNPIATFSVVGERYELTLSGKRENMAHDPISLMFRGTSPVSETLILPRISGEVLGNEIPVKSGSYNYLGKVTFKDNQMLVELYYDNNDDKIQQPTQWNGKYLVQELKK
ncbi:hypothetical protein [Undibacterium sp. Ji22W]|uniref:hypothetical protein n=1 Tax=Undibacterium sp. Ji22W TaxID=3413038 RepID=UPI003BF0E211